MSKKENKLSEDARVERYARILKEQNGTMNRIAWVFYNNDSEKRKDLVQEIRLAVLRGLDDFRGKSSEKTWVWSIGTRIGAKEIRPRKTQIINFEEIPEEYHPLTKVDAEEIIERVDYESLRPWDKVVLVALMEDFKLEDIREMVGLEKGPFANRISRMIKRLGKLRNDGKLIIKDQQP